MPGSGRLAAQAAEMTQTWVIAGGADCVICPSALIAHVLPGVATLSVLTAVSATRTQVPAAAASAAVVGPASGSGTNSGFLAPASKSTKAGSTKMSGEGSCWAADSIAQIAMRRLAARPVGSAAI